MLKIIKLIVWDARRVWDIFRVFLAGAALCKNRVLFGFPVGPSISKTKMTKSKQTKPGERNTNNKLCIQPSKFETFQFFQFQDGWLDQLDSASVKP